MELVSPLLVNTIAIAAIIAGLAFGAWWIVGLCCMRSREAEQELPQVQFPSDLREAVSGPPPVLIVFYAFIALSLVGYVLYVWLGGVTY